MHKLNIKHTSNLLSFIMLSTHFILNLEMIVKMTNGPIVVFMSGVKGICH